MEPESSLPCSQEAAIGFCPESDESRPQPLPYFPKVHFNILPYTRRSSVRFPYWPPGAWSANGTALCH